MIKEQGYLEAGAVACDDLRDVPSALHLVSGIRDLFVGIEKIVWPTGRPELERIK
jgi:hypothetical protein